MRIKAYASVQRLKEILNQYETFGTPLYESKIGESNVFLVFEPYSIANSNRMSISVVLEEKEGFTLIHFVTAGSSQGWVFKFDWGSASRRKNRLHTALTNNNIKFEVISE